MLKKTIFHCSIELFDGRCGLNPAHKSQHVHHILPRGSGGKDELTNLIPLCFKCHGKIHQEGTRKWREKLETNLRQQLQRKGLLVMV